jgi:hypothetical protein
MRQPATRFVASDRDRISAIEKRADAHDMVLTPMAKQVAEIYELYTMARGVNWFLVKVCVAVGGFVAFVAACLGAFSTILPLVTGH